MTFADPGRTNAPMTNTKPSPTPAPKDTAFRRPRRRPPPCNSLGTHGLRRARLYACGWRCDSHTPAAQAGRPEPPEGAGWPTASTPPTDPTPEHGEHTP